MPQEFKCPLCESPLSESRYYEIVGVWEAKKKFENNLRKQLEEAKETRKKLLEEKETIKKRFEEQKAELIKKAQEETRVVERKKIKEELEKLKKEKLEAIRKAQIEGKELARKEIERIEKEKRELIARQKKEMNRARVNALAEGKLKEKGRADRMSLMLQQKMLQIQENTKTIEELKEQLKKGTTPQVEGLNLEEELIKELKERFPNDIIEHHGKVGDILQRIVYKDKEIGIIVYECKKTKKFQKSYVSGIKDAVAKRNATYGILVTTASDKDRMGFWVDKGIFIVHPFGAIYIAEVIRNGLITIHSLKLSDKQIDEQAKKLMDYIKSDDFKNSVGDTIFRAKELSDILAKEITLHENLWKKRGEHYNSVLRNAVSVESKTESIMKEEPLPIPLAQQKKKRARNKI